ncbi:MAG: head GIN domain-containing protein [Pseudomonadota bacterium]
MLKTSLHQGLPIALTIAISLSTLAAAPAIAATKSLDVTSLEEIEISANVEVEFRQSDTVSAELIGDEDDFERLKITIGSDKLKIKQKKNSLFSNYTELDIRVVLRAPTVEELDLSLGLRADLQLGNQDDLRIDANTGVEVEISGTCDDVEYDISTGAEVEAGELRCNDADVTANTGGEIELYASGKLEARATLGGEITVLGRPKSVDLGTSFGGEIEILDDGDPTIDDEI